MTPPGTDGGQAVSQDARRVAEELHDGAIQELTLARLQIELLCASVGDADGAGEQLAEVAALLGDASVRLQEIVRSLAGPAELV